MEEFRKYVTAEPSLIDHGGESKKRNSKKHDRDLPRHAELLRLTL
jgi:hypothetical protein